jgi:hypothetical protein
MADTQLIGLNNRWRLAHDGLVQWVLQRREGSNWYGRNFLTSKASLLKAIEDSCGEVGTDTLDLIETWPEKYRDWLITQAQSKTDA